MLLAFFSFILFYILYVAPYSRPVPYSRHPPYSRHFFNDTHENDCVWALFPIAVSGDHSSTQVCKEILSILSIFFGEASLWYHAKLFLPDVSLFHWTLIFLKSRVNSRWFHSFFPSPFGVKTTLHWTFSFIFTTIVVPVSTGKFPRARSWILCSHTKSTLALKYSPVLHLKLDCRSYCHWSFSFFSWVRVRVADFSVGLWFGLGEGYLVWLGLG